MPDIIRREVPGTVFGQRQCMHPFARLWVRLHAWQPTTPTGGECR
jgi:hypothetical protein